MENLEARIMEVLQDPDQMEQIMQIAKSFGAGTAAPSEESEPSLLNTVMQLTQNGSPRDANRNALLCALLPYLKPDRQRRLEKAMQLAKFSGLAELALQSLKEPQEGG